MKKILVTTDGSKNATKALLKTKKLAESLDAKVTILNVMKDTVVNPYATLDYTTITQMNEDLKKVGEKILDNALILFEDFKGQVDLKLERGDPADLIIKEATEGDYDMLVMGCRGLGTFSRAMLGSVSNKVLNHVKTDVLIIK